MTLILGTYLSYPNVQKYLLEEHQLTRKPDSIGKTYRVYKKLKDGVANKENVKTSIIDNNTT